MSAIMLFSRFFFCSAPNQAPDLYREEFIIIIPQWNLAQITCGVEIYYRLPRSYHRGKDEIKVIIYP